jgi:hypothetical protein
MMRTHNIILIGILALAISGCFVKSLHPFYKESDVIFKNDLLGTWLDEDSATWHINPFVFSKGFMKGDSIDNSYLMEMYDDTSNISTFNVHLFKMGDKHYLDFEPIRGGRYDEMIDFHMIPAHSIARIEFISEEEVLIAWFNEDWIKDLFEENRIKIAHEVIQTVEENFTKEYVLTASTDELQKFLVKYGSMEDIYLCDEGKSNFICTRLKRVR